MSWFNWLRRPSPSTTSDEHVTDPDEIQPEQAGPVDEPQGELAPPTATEPDGDGRVRVDAVTLWTAFRENQVEAERRFGDITFDLEGVVNRVDRDQRGRIRVHFKVSDYYTLHALYPETARDQVAELRPGDQVSLAARVVDTDSGYVVVEPVATEA